MRFSFMSANSARTRRPFIQTAAVLSPAILSSLLVNLIQLGCSGSSDPIDEPLKLSVGGTYGTAVSMASNTCGNTVSIQPLQTVVAHASGATTFTLTHGVAHSGTINSTAAFTTSPTVVQDPGNGGVQSTISIAGQFSTTGFVADATVDVLQTQQPNNCKYVVHWVGTKQGSPNVIP
jgi:hypothetical protein